MTKREVRSQEPEARRRLASGLCVSVSRWQNPEFKIKKPSQNARKQLKVNKGQLRLHDTPTGGPRLARQIRCPIGSKSFIFSRFHHIPTARFWSFLPPKNLRFMNDFSQRQFVNNSQRFCLRSCQSPRVLALPLSAPSPQIPDARRLAPFNTQLTQLSTIRPLQIGKVMQGKASVFDTPRGAVPKITQPYHLPNITIRCPSKVLKVNTGKYSIFDTPRGSPNLSAKTARKETQNPLFSTVLPVFQPSVLCRFLPPKTCEL